MTPQQSAFFALTSLMILGAFLTRLTLTARFRLRRDADGSCVFESEIQNLFGRRRLNGRVAAGSRTACRNVQVRLGQRARTVVVAVAPDGTETRLPLGSGVAKDCYEAAARIDEVLLGAAQEYSRDTDQRAESLRGAVLGLLVYGALVALALLSRGAQR